MSDLFENHIVCFLKMRLIYAERECCGLGREYLERVFRGLESTHYENLPMQYTQIFLALKIENFQVKILIFFLFLLKT